MWATTAWPLSVVLNAGCQYLGLVFADKGPMSAKREIKRPLVLYYTVGHNTGQCCVSNGLLILPRICFLACWRCVVWERGNTHTRAHTHTHTHTHTHAQTYVVEEERFPEDVQTHCKTCVSSTNQNTVYLLLLGRGT